MLRSSKLNLALSAFQLANAANYGAKAVLLYSDPKDYAKAGGDPKDTYPNTAWLPASGVRRGSVYTFPGAGDPQTPGIAAISGMYRRSTDDSELPPIPAHPMGYGDAIHFLSKMEGDSFVRIGVREFLVILGLSYIYWHEVMRVNRKLI